MASLIERRNIRSSNMQEEVKNADSETSSEYISTWNGSSEKICMIDIDRIKPFEMNGQKQPYKINEAKIQRIMVSINDIGILQPLLVRPISDNTYQILAGHHRYIAAVRSGLHQVPCEVKRNIDDMTAYKMVAESNTRTDGTLPSEDARIIKFYMDNRKNDDANRTTKEIAAKFGISPKSIYRYLNLLNLIPRLVEKVDAKIIPFGRFDGLANILTAKQQEAVANYIDQYDIKKFSANEISCVCDYCLAGGAEAELTAEKVLELIAQRSEEKSRQSKEDRLYNRIYEAIPGLTMDQAELDELIIELLTEYNKTKNDYD